MNMQWDIIKDLVHYLGGVILIIWTIKLIMCIITEIFSRHCRHCGKKV